MYPGIKLTIGPAIESGFYYDIDPGEHIISEKDLPAIEKRMIELARGKHAFALRSISKSEALSFYKVAGNQYKTELIEALEDGTITFCDHADFTDLCRGGHIPHTGIIKAVKLTNIAGAYWRGDEKNKQLTRIYGVSFPKQKLLSEHLELLEEAKNVITANWALNSAYLPSQRKWDKACRFGCPRGSTARKTRAVFAQSANQSGL